MEKLELLPSLKCFFFPRNNHWLKRILLVFVFVFFDYFVTLAFCRFPCEEANLFARGFMESLGIPLGLTLFVLVANLPIYMSLSLDSHIVRFPFKVALVTEFFVDVMFAWFVAGLHFSGGTSWFWFASDLTRQSLGTLLYMGIALLLVKPYKPHYDD